MTALVTFAQDFQHFHLVTPDHFAPFKQQIPRSHAGLVGNWVFTRTL